MSATSIAQTIAKMQIGSADKKAFINLLNAIVDDNTTLRTKLAAITAKLDADAGVTDTNYGTTGAIAASAINLVK